MDEGQEPIDDVLKTLEVSLINLLEKVRQDPWSLLIFQTLFWSFRRWAIHYLISNDTVGSMHEYLWDSFTDLVKEHAPEGLQEFGVVWLSPSNIGDRTDMLEELNSYFLCIVDRLNHSIETEDDDEQNSLSIFLDETITDILGEWLDGLSEYRIYPKDDESLDVFPKERIFTIMQKILEKTSKRVALPPNPTVPVAPVEEPTAPTATAPPVEEPTAPLATATAVPVEEPATAAPTVAPPQETIASALRRNRTKKNHPERKNVSSTRNRRKYPST